jgi:hypothetical protein
MENKRETLLKGIGITKPEYEIKRNEWAEICIYKKLTENFIREFQNEVVWSSISKNQLISENFIREFENNVYWIYISKYQRMSDDFMSEFEHKINWRFTLAFQKVNFNIIKKMMLKINYTEIGQFETSHLRETEKNELTKILKLKNMFVEKKDVF